MLRSRLTRAKSTAFGIVLAATCAGSAGAQTICPFGDESQITGTVQSIPPSGVTNPGVGVRRIFPTSSDPDYLPAGCHIPSTCAQQPVEGACMVWPMAIAGWEFSYGGGEYTRATADAGSCWADPPPGEPNSKVVCAGSFALTVYKNYVHKTPPPRCGTACQGNVGEPVDVISGNMWLTHSEIAIPDAPGVSFVRGYNSLDAVNVKGGAFGRGWFHSYEGSIAFPDPGIMQLRQTDTTVLYFRDADSDGRFDPMVPVTEASYVQATGGNYVRHKQSGGTETYNASGKLIAMTDDQGRATTLVYDATGKLTAVTGSGSRGVTLTYRADGKIESLDGPAGRVASYSYDVNGFLDSVAYGDGTGYRFAYGNVAELLSVIDFAGHVVERHEYQSGKAITSELADGHEKYTISYLTSGNEANVTDANGNLTKYKWHSFQGSRQLVRIEGPCSACASSSDVRTWTYDVNGRVLTQTDSNGTTTYTYHPTGEIATETDALNRTTSYTVDSKGRVLTKTDPGGHVTTYVYGTNGPTSVTETVTASQNRTTSMTYNTAGLVDAITDPRGKVTTLGYNSYGDLTSATDPLTHATTFGYDSLGRRTTVTDALNHVTTTQYDPRGKVTRITNHDNTYTSFTYDNSGRRTSVTDPMGKTTYYVYDAVGRLSSVVDPMNQVTRYGYDAMSRMTSLKDAKGNTDLPPENWSKLKESRRGV